MSHSTENEEKSSIIERWNRTIKYNVEVFAANNTQKYINILPSMVDKYNNTYHRSIRPTPPYAHNPANYEHLHNTLYAEVNTEKATSPEFHVGDKVRITRKKATFENGFTPNWREEVFECESN